MRYEFHVDGKMLQVKEFQGDKFIRFVPNKQHLQLREIRSSDLATPNLRRKGYGGHVMVHREIG